LNVKRVLSSGAREGMTGTQKKREFQAIGLIHATV
jgi:hypothetical protein